MLHNINLIVVIGLSILLFLGTIYYYIMNYENTCCSNHNSDLHVSFDVESDGIQNTLHNRASSEVTVVV